MVQNSLQKPIFIKNKKSNQISNCTNNLIDWIQYIYILQSYLYCNFIQCRDAYPVLDRIAVRPNTFTSNARQELYQQKEHKKRSLMMLETKEIEREKTDKRHLQN